MNNIEKISIISRNKLSEEFYFNSLLEEACKLNLLSEADIEKIQLECLELLAYKTDRYIGSDNSSVQVDIAKNIMESNMYTIGLWLKSLTSPDDAITALKESTISELYENGRKRINIKIRAAKHMHSMVMQNKVDTKNYTYNATIGPGIRGFFKIYYPDFEAHDIRITADYPLYNPVQDLAGIEFIEEYLESLYYENMFCRNFASKDIHHLLCGYDANYGDLVINIFEQVLTCALGCRLAGIDASGLNLSALKREQLYVSLSQKSSDEIRLDVLSAYDDLRDRFSAGKAALDRYMAKNLNTIVFNICHAIEIDTLEKVFISPAHPELNPKIIFSFGETMDNETYREIIAEILECDYLDDKIAIIKNKVHSLADLQDLFFDAYLNADEIKALLSELEATEIAALAHRFPFKMEIDAIDFRESEKQLRLCLHSYIESLPQAQQSFIAKTISLFGDAEQE